MQAEETRLLNERSQKTGAARRLTTFVTVAGTLVGAVFILLAGFAVNREIGVSARMRAQVSALNTELEQRVEQRTAAVQSEIAARIATEQKLRASEELRSEEHTSELQSRGQLVCRLLLEKKNPNHA